jgi:hypothetical protein
MAALSPAQENALSLWLVIFLAAVLALSLAAVITSPPRTDSPPAEEADTEPDLPRLAPGPPGSPLPRRVAGQSGVAYPAGDPARPPGVTWPPRVAGGPPWGPAPKPGAPAQYGGQVIDTSTGRTWRCPHNHPTEESASRCADFMQEQIERLGWAKATGEHL